MLNYFRKIIWGYKSNSERIANHIFYDFLCNISVTIFLNHLLLYYYFSLSQMLYKAFQLINDFFCLKLDDFSLYFTMNKNYS